MFLRIQKKSTGEFLVNENGSVVTIENHTTLFNNQDDLLGSFSYPGTWPLEDNRAIIENAHFISTSIKLRSFDAIMWLGNIPYKEVKFVFSIEGKTIKGSCLADLGVVANQLKTLKLNELFTAFDEGLIADFESKAAFKAYMTASAEAVPGDFPLVFFPFINDAAYKDVTPDHYGDYPTITFPVERVFNRWEFDEVGNGSFKLDADNVHQQSQTPFFLLTYAIKYVIKFLGFTPVGKWLNEQSSHRIVIYSNITLDILRIPEVWYWMPGITIAEFFKAIRTEFGLLIDFDVTRKVCLVESIDNLSATEDTMDLRYYQLDDFREIQTTTMRYVITQQPDDKDKAFSDTDKQSLPKVTLGDLSGSATETPIDLASVCTKMKIETAPTPSGVAPTANWKVPYLQQPVFAATDLLPLNTVSYDDSHNFGLRFLMYYGMQSNSEGHLYPFGSSDNYDVFNRSISNTGLSLAANDVTLLPIRKYIAFMADSKPFEMGLTLSLTAFFNIRAQKRFIIRDFNNATINCLLDQVAADLGDGREIKAKATVYPILWSLNTKQVVDPLPIDPPVTDPPYDNGTVYARLRIVNQQNHTTPDPNRYDYTDGDIVVSFFADSGATTPKAVTQLDVRVKMVESNDGVASSPVITHFSSTGTSNQVYTAAWLHGNPNGHYKEISYTLLSSEYYTVIP